MALVKNLYLQKQNKNVVPRGEVIEIEIPKPGISLSSFLILESFFLADYVSLQTCTFCVHNVPRSRRLSNPVPGSPYPSSLVGSEWSPPSRKLARSDR